MSSMVCLILVLATSCLLLATALAQVPTISDASTWTFDRNTTCYAPCRASGATFITLPWKSSYGTQSSTAAADITAAFNKIKAAGKGGTLTLGAGTFILATQISIPSMTCFRGAGISSTVLKLKDDAESYFRAGMLRTYRTTSVVVSDMMLDGNRDKNTLHANKRFGFYSENSKYVCLDRVHIKNHQGYGFDPHGNKAWELSTGWGQYLWIDNCISEGNGLDGYTIDQTQYVRLTNSTAENNDRHGINLVTGTMKVHIDNNIVRNNGAVSGVGCGIVVQDPKYEGVGPPSAGERYGTKLVVMTNNALTNNKKNSFCMRDTQNVLIDSNTASAVETDTAHYCLGFDSVDVPTSLNILASNNVCNRARNYYITYTNGGGSVGVQVASSNIFNPDT